MVKKRYFNCGECVRMDEVGEDDPCPKLRKCIVFAKEGSEGIYFIPRKKNQKRNVKK